MVKVLNIFNYSFKTFCNSWNCRRSCLDFWINWNHSFYNWCNCWNHEIVETIVSTIDVNVETIETHKVVELVWFLKLLQFLKLPKFLKLLKLLNLFKSLELLNLTFLRFGQLLKLLICQNFCLNNLYNCWNC